MCFDSFHHTIAFELDIVNVLQIKHLGSEKISNLPKATQLGSSRVYAEN